jgi:SlyX protein
VNSAPSEHLEQLNDRVDNLESQVAFQEDTIEQLNDALSQQQLMLDKMNQQIRLMAERLKQVQPSNIASEAEETPPPHY